MAKYEIKSGVGIIPEGATAIDNYAFKDCVELLSVVIPDTVEVIGDEAFYNCKSLSEIVLPESVKIIKNGAFNKCKRRIRIYVPANQIKHYKSFLPKHLHNKIKSIACMELYKTEGILKKMQLIKNKPQIFFAWLNADKTRYAILIFILFFVFGSLAVVLFDD